MSTSSSTLARRQTISDIRDVPSRLGRFPTASSLSTENSFKSALSAATSRRPDFEQESPADIPLPEPLAHQESSASLETVHPGISSDVSVSQATDAPEGSQPEFPGRYPAEYTDVAEQRASPSSPQSNTQDTGGNSDDDDDSGDDGQVEILVELSEYDAAEKLAQDRINDILALVDQGMLTQESIGPLLISLHRGFLDAEPSLENRRSRDVINLIFLAGLAVMCAIFAVGLFTTYNFMFPVKY